MNYFILITFIYLILGIIYAWYDTLRNCAAGDKRDLKKRKEKLELELREIDDALADEV